MPRRIGIEIDMKIMADCGMGLMNKDIAKRYGVSPSYVSKVCQGKKELDIFVAEPNKTISEDFTAYTDDVEAIKAMIETRHVLVSTEDILEYLESQLTKSIVRAKIYTELIKKYKGEK